MIWYWKKFVKEKMKKVCERIKNGDGNKLGLLTDLLGQLVCRIPRLFLWLLSIHLCNQTSLFISFLM